MKKCLSLLLVLLLALSYASFAESFEADRFGKYAEPVTLAILSTDGKDSATEYDSSDPTRKSAAENIWIDAYKDYLNIDVKRIVAEDSTALNALLNTGMAGGDLPDIMIVSKEMFYVMAENDVLMDLRPAFDEYGDSYWISQCMAGAPGVLEKGTLNGQLLGFPVFGNSYNNSEVLWIRADWLDKVGMEAPETLDEMVNTAQAFMEAQLGGENTIGLAFNNVSKSIAAAYGVVMNTWTQDADGQYVYSNTLDGMKDALLFMQDMYAQGIIKSDFAVTDIVGEEIANSYAGMFYAAGWAGSTDVKNNQMNDETAEWIAVPIPTLDGERVKQWTNNTIGSYIVVNKNCAHPEAIFKMLELELYQQYEGTYEERLKYLADASGYQIWNFRVFRNVALMDYDLMRSRILLEGIKNNTPAEEVPYFFAATYDRCKTIYENKLAGLEYDRSRLGLTIVFTEAYRILNDLLNQGLLIGEYDGEITENMSLYQETINTALNSAMLKVIMGDDISVFEQAVETWYASGGQAITDDVNAYYGT